MASGLDQVHLAFRAAIQAAAGQLCHEGDLAFGGDGEELLEAEQDGRHLQLAVRKGGILRAAHRGAEDEAERAVLDVFCQVLEGLPIQEAADHAGHHVLARLRDPNEPPPVSGVVTPWNADPVFHKAMELVRRIHADFVARHAVRTIDNFWNPTISKEWLRMAESEQLARVDEILSSFLSEKNLQAGDLVVVGIESNIRVLLAFAEGVGYERKPSLLMDFERTLRTATGNRLEVFAEEMKDTNKIRRL